MTDREQLKQDAIDALYAWDASYTGNGPFHDDTMRLAGELKKKLALISERSEGTPVWPCKKYIGARFRFEPGPGEAGTGICKLYCLDGEFLWSMAEDASLFRFRPDARIIPIPEGEEE